MARISKNLEEGGASIDFSIQVCVEYNHKKIKDINQRKIYIYHPLTGHVQPWNKAQE